VAVGSAGAFVTNGGALGTPSSGTVTNLTGTASININGTVGATTANTGAFTTLSSTGAVNIGSDGVSAGAYTNVISLAAPAASGSTRGDFSRILDVAGSRSLDTGVSSSGAWLQSRDQNDYSVNYTLQLNPNGGSTTVGGGLAVTGTLSATGVVTFSNYGAGSAVFSAAGVISSVSDETWKIKDGIPTDPDAMLKKLKPGYWYYNDEKKKTFGADRQLGFYAQNVNAAIGPEAAPEPEEGKPWGYYDRSVLAITVMSLQKALATIEKLSARLEAK
jgi:hypothetical protein